MAISEFIQRGLRLAVTFKLYHESKLRFIISRKSDGSLMESCAHLKKLRIRKGDT